MPKKHFFRTGTLLLLLWRQQAWQSTIGWFYKLVEGLLNKKVNSTTQVFALGGRLVHFKSKGDMAYCICLLCHQNSTKIYLLIRNLRRTVSSHQNLFVITGHNLSALTGNPVTWSFGKIVVRWVCCRRVVLCFCILQLCNIKIFSGWIGHLFGPIGQFGLLWVMCGSYMVRWFAKKCQGAKENWF